MRLDHGALIFAPMDDNRVIRAMPKSPIHDCLLARDMTRLTALTQSALPKTLFNSPNLSGDPPLCYILSCTELEDWNTDEVIEAMELLVDGAGANVSNCDGSGNTVLHLAAARGDLQLLEKCLLWTQPREGKSADDIIDMDLQNLDASKYKEGDWQVIDGDTRYLSEEERAEKASDPEFLNDTALNIAIKEEHDECAMRLLQAGASVNLADVDGDTPLVCALDAELTDVAAACVAKGARVDVKSKNLACNRLLHHYASRGKVDVLRLLMDAPGFDAGALLNEARGTHNFTPLHCAARGGRLEACQLLVERGADLSTADKNGATPADLADANKKFAVAEWLRSKDNNTN